MIEQILIAVFGLLFIGLTAANRIFYGTLSGAVCFVTWLVASVDAAQWGAVVVSLMLAFICVLGFVQRWPRHLLSREQCRQ